MQQLLLTMKVAAVAQLVRAFDPQAEVWVFESQQRQTYVVKTGSVSSTAKSSAIEWVSRVLGDEHYKRCGMLKNSHSSMAIGAAHRTRNPKQTNKQSYNIY